jgi:DNA repair protein RadD
MLTLRAYQRAAIDRIYSYFQSNDGNPLIVVPTGGGKSLIMAEFVREVLCLEALSVSSVVGRFNDHSH